MNILLQSFGYEVRVAGTIADAMAAIDPSVDAIVLDLMLPDGEGSQLLAHVRNAGLKMRVCVTTGVNNPAILANLQQLRPDCVLKKPIDVERLLSHL